MPKNATVDTEVGPLPRRQAWSLEKLKTHLVRDSTMLRSFPDTYEIKEWDAKLLGYGIVSVVVEVGMKNDAGTMASILCRDRFHVFIGKNGGMFQYVRRTKGGKSRRTAITKYGYLLKDAK